MDDNPHPTYSLRPAGHSPAEYYRSISSLADDWLAQSREMAGDVIEAYAAYRQQQAWPPRSFEELSFELLALGVLLRERGGQAAGFPEWAAQALEGLVAVQAKQPRAARLIKSLRGWVNGLGAQLGSEAGSGHLDALALARSAGMSLRLENEPDVGCTLYVRRLVAWLNSMGRPAQARRFAAWQSFIESYDPQGSQDIILLALALAQEFALQSSVILDVYTLGIQDFLASVAPRSRWRYDRELVTRTRLEYHLGMLGTEVLSRAYRQRFLAAARRLVILPDCMCLRRGEPGGPACPAQLTLLGRRCTGCDPACHVDAIAHLGQQHGFEVYMLPDAGRKACLQNCLSASKGEPPGVVGVACALTAWDSGWEVDDLGLPAQAVLLDYAGCRDHWSNGDRTETGLVTDVDLAQLKKVLGLDAYE